MTVVVLTAAPLPSGRVAGKEVAAGVEEEFGCAESGIASKVLRVDLVLVLRLPLDLYLRFAIRVLLDWH